MIDNARQRRRDLFFLLLRKRFRVEWDCVCVVCRMGIVFSLDERVCGRSTTCRCIVIIVIVIWEQESVIFGILD